MPFATVLNDFPSGWHKVVSTWARLNVEYFEKRGTLPACHVGECNSALFTAAAWKCGHSALCGAGAEGRRRPG